jgi:hypothetical protein
MQALKHLPKFNCRYAAFRQYLCRYSPLATFWLRLRRIFEFLNTLLLMKRANEKSANSTVKIAKEINLPQSDLTPS